MQSLACLLFSVLPRNNIWARTLQIRPGVSYLQRDVQDLSAVPISDFVSQDYAENLREDDSGV